LTPADFITLAKEINAIAADSLTILKPETGTAGEFLQSISIVRQETGLSGEEFKRELFYSEQNYEILKRTHGKDVAQNYSYFSEFLRLELEPIMNRSVEQQLRFLASLTRNYQDHPCQQAYSLTSKFIDSSTVPADFLAYAEMLTAKIAAGCHPIHIAAFALSQHAQLHAFAHGNRRTARIFINTLLMMLGHAPIVIPKEEVNKYYLAIERATQQDVSELEYLLRGYASHTAPNFEIKLKDKFYPLMVKLESGETLLCEEFDFTLTLPAQLGPISIAATLNNCQNAAEAYLNQAIKFQVSHSVVADFYYRGYKRLTQREVPELAETICAGKQKESAKFNTSLDDTESAVLSKFKKPIYHIAMHETARLTGAEAQTAGLFTKLSTVNLAVLFKDQENNISLTHMDPRTPLTFLLREAKKMRGTYTVDVFRCDFNLSGNDKVVHAEIAKLGKIVNQKGNNQTRILTKQTLLILAGKLFAPEKDVILNLNVFNSRYSKEEKKIPVHLHGATLIEGSKTYLARETERMLQLIVGMKTETMPAVVFDKGWTYAYNRLTPKAQQALRDCLHETHGKKYQAYVKEESLKTEGAARQAVVEKLDENLNIYRQEAKRSVYGTLATFFHSIKTPMPDSALSCMTSYVETEELGIFRQLYL
jgi:hypothetical protein